LERITPAALAFTDWLRREMADTNRARGAGSATPM
jgi:hypothetical protein